MKDKNKQTLPLVNVPPTTKRAWALVLGGSSGLGLASSIKLARHGFNIIVVHRDLNIDIKQVNEDFKNITLSNVELISFNVDAVNAEKRNGIITQIKSKLDSSDRIQVLVHSIAKASMKPMYSETHTTLNHQDFLITINAMALSLYDWTKDLNDNGLFAEDSRIISFTSEGNSKAWPGYGTVSAAKATLEAITRNIALEFAHLGIKANCIQAGATDTRAFSMIPNSSELRDSALKRNPNGRLTTPEDVANVVYLLTTEEAKWITGSIIKVDGGESLS